MAQEDVAALLNDMSPDDRTMFLEELPAPVTRQLLALLTPQERAIASTLLGYPGGIGRPVHDAGVHRGRGRLDDSAGARLHPAHGQDSETLNVIYIVDAQGQLIDDLRIRELLLTAPSTRVAELMDRRWVALKATDDQSEAVAAFRAHDRTALPVTDTTGVLIGIVTIDDVLHVVETRTTEEIQRIGGSEALDEPYMVISFAKMIQKRAGWLTALFIGEMLTATAMSAFEAEIERAVVLALFVPLIISSGGNSGSQASTLVIRALALGEVTAARLVASRPPRDCRRPGARGHPRNHRLPAHRDLVGLLDAVRPALAPRRHHRVAGARRHRAVGHARRDRCCPSCCVVSGSTLRPRPRHSWRRSST